MVEMKCYKSEWGELTGKWETTMGGEDLWEKDREPAFTATVGLWLFSSLDLKQQNMAERTLIFALSKKLSIELGLGFGELGGSIYINQFLAQDANKDFDSKSTLN